MLLVGALGLSIYFGGRLQWFHKLHAATFDQLYMKLLLPVMFFFAFAANTHLDENVGVEIAVIYGGMVFVLYGLTLAVLACFSHVRENSGVHALHLTSNHLMLSAAPLAGLLLGLDAIPVIVYGMLCQFLLILVSVITLCKSWAFSLNMLSGYYAQTLWIWVAIVVGLMVSYLPWNMDVMAFFSDGFDWTCLLNAFFSCMVMATKSLDVQPSLRSSGLKYLSKILLVCIILVGISHWVAWSEAQVSLLVIMLFSPGIIMKAPERVGGNEIIGYWRNVITGCNIWYMITMVVLALLPQLFI